jgi:hypothetical protein
MRVSNVSAHNFKVVVVWHFFQPAPIVKRVVKTESADLAPFCQEHFCKMGADETVGSGNEYGLV